MTAPAFLARTLTVALALGTLMPGALRAQQNEPVTAPSPLPTPVVTLTPIPYPAYGTPAPDVARQVSKPGVPQAVSLTQAVDIAVAQSPVFATQRAAYQAIRAKYGAAKGALFPNVSGSAGITRDYGQSSGGTGGGTGSGGTGTGGGLSSGMFTSENGRVQVQQLIFDGGRVIAGLRSAKESDIAGRDTLLRQLQGLAFNVATAYFGVLQANATVDADALLVRQFETQEANVRAQIRAGAAARSDLAAAQFQTAQARGNLISAQGNAIAAQSAFATTLGLDADTAVSPQSLAPGISPKLLSYTGALQEALGLRPDYLAAQHSVDSAQANLRFAKLARFPSINANASDGTSRTLIASPAVDTGYQSSRSLGATVTIPIFDQGITNFNVATAASQLDQANAGLIQAKLTVESDVRGALSGLISAQALLTQAQAELQSAQVNLQAVQARYRVGAATITDLVTAEANLATAQRDDINAIYGERLAEEKYQFALGASDLKL